MSFHLPRAVREAMAARAEADFPRETCGLVLRRGAELEVRPMANIQDRLHAEDPATHPRDARTAYCFDPGELIRALKEIDSGAAALHAIYHSHPDHDAYFSAMDSAAAAPLGEPSYPGAVYLVFSVRGGKIVDLKAFAWSEEDAGYAEVGIVEG
jgi:proteasome lid subunit RPN8/RPN11